MSKAKLIIDEYITPFASKSFYVAAKPTAEQLNSMFYKLIDNEQKPLIDSDADLHEYDACTILGAYRKSDDTPHVVIAYDHSHGVPDLVNTVAHESVHAAKAILESSDIELSDDTEECYAYHVGYTAECMWRTINKLNNEPK